MNLCRAEKKNFAVARKKKKKSTVESCDSEVLFSSRVSRHLVIVDAVTISNVILVLLMTYHYHPPSLHYIYFFFIYTNFYALAAERTSHYDTSTESWPLHGVIARVGFRSVGSLSTIDTTGADVGDVSMSFTRIIRESPGCSVTK